MKRPIVLQLVTLLASLLATQDTDAQKITEVKSKIGKVLGDMESQDDPELVNATKSFANSLVAATPPAKSDVENSSKVGEIKLPPKRDSKEPPVADNKQPDNKQPTPQQQPAENALGSGLSGVGAPAPPATSSGSTENK